MTADDFRDLALAMEGAAEGAHMGHPDFRANGRIFASLTADEKSATVMLTPEEQQEFLRLSPAAFSPASGAWGRQGCTTVLLERAGKASVRSAVLLAWQRVVDSPAPRRAKSTKRKR